MYSHASFISCVLRREQIISAACRSVVVPRCVTHLPALYRGPSVRFPESNAESCTYCRSKRLERLQSSSTSSIQELGTFILVVFQSHKTAAKSKSRGDCIAPLSKLSSLSSWASDFWMPWLCPANLVWLRRSWCWQIMIWNLVCKISPCEPNTDHDNVLY